MDKQVDASYASHLWLKKNHTQWNFGTTCDIIIIIIIIINIIVVIIIIHIIIIIHNNVILMHYLNYYHINYCYQ